MKNDDFAFFNQQLGMMLRDGVPLEGALRQLSANMERGDLRAELELLGADLKNGTPLKTAIASRKLPDFYKQMVLVGVESNDLPGVLTLVADYYKQVDAAWLRLKGLMVYPLIVLTAAFVLSGYFTFMFTRIIGNTPEEMVGMAGTRAASYHLLASIWVPPVMIGLVLAATMAMWLIPPLHRKLRWWLPAFKDAKLFQVASSMWLMLKTGGNLDDAIGMVQQLEHGTPASAELAQWKARLAGGRGKFADLAEPGRAFPPMFLWLVGNAGEDLAGGFQRAAEVYGAKAANRVEMFLYTVMPFSILVLGGMIICQVVPAVRALTSWMSVIE